MSKIQIAGHADFEVEPDTVTIAVDISERNFDYSKCAEALNRRTACARETLIGEGVAAEDIRSHDYRIDKLSDHQCRQSPDVRFSGWHYLRVQLPLDQARINRLLGALTHADAELEIGLSYQLLDPTPHRDIAETLAVKDALRRGAAIATAANSRIVGMGAIIVDRAPSSTRSWDISADLLSPCFSPPNDSSQGVSVTPKRLNVEASVHVTLKIAPMG
jgi:uncharacterized protein YggE